MLAVSVVLTTPGVVGVPVIWPLTAFRLRPAGRLLPVPRA